MRERVAEESAAAHEEPAAPAQIPPVGDTPIAIPPMPAPVRGQRLGDYLTARPVYVVWEVTMKCDQPCQHCGSRAGPSRPQELTPEQALKVAESLAPLGTREVVLIGGEAYLRPDVHDIIRTLASSGIRVIMQTGGRNFSRERARALREAGLSAVGVSVDGPALIHDRLRGNLGSHHAALTALDNAHAEGLIVTANTQINRLNWDRLHDTARELRAHHVQSWQVQLTTPMGRAADHPEWILEPWRVPQVVEILADIQRKAAEDYRGGIPFNVFANNNIGYFGPHEQILRSRPGGPEAHWQGCQAGRQSMGIESDGTVKACPSLPTHPYAGGNVLDLPLEAIWQDSPEVRFTRDRDTAELWGFCATCYYADVCRAGCSWTAHVTLGRRGNNPFCYHRAVQLRKKGLRETLVQKERAPNEPYDYGRFEIVVEPIPQD
ncbi:MAG: radical SAM protein [Polyangiaceae bacterium]